MLKVQVKTLQSNSKQGSFITFEIVATSKSKTILIGSIVSGKFSFINPFRGTGLQQTST